MSFPWIPALRPAFAGLPAGKSGVVFRGEERPLTRASASQKEAGHVGRLKGKTVGGEGDQRASQPPSTARTVPWT